MAPSRPAAGTRAPDRPGDAGGHDRRGPDLRRAPLPRRLQVEVTGACNLRCRMCLVRYRPKLDRETASFPLDRYVALLDALPTLEQVTLQGLGEPLLHPDLVAMVAAASERGIRVGFNTNATLLTTARAEALIDAGLDWLHVSVDGATPGTFEHIRDGARFGQVVRNLRRLVEVRRRRGGGRPTIQLNAVLMRANAGELPDLVRLAADVGVDRLWLQALSHDFSDTEDRGDGCAGEGCGAGDGAVGVAESDRAAYVEIRRFTEDQALWADQDGIPEVMDEARRLAEELGLDLRLPDAGPPDPADPAGDGWPEGPEAPGSEGGRADGGDAPLPCDWPWSGVYVTHAGKVQPCCMVMGEDRLVLGDLSDGSFEDVWNGPTYQAFREELLSDRPPAVCRGCSWYRRVF